MFLTFVLVINNFYNIFYVLFALLFALIETGIYQSKFEKEAKDIEEDETLLKEAKNIEEYQYYAKEARDKAYHISFSKSIMTYLSGAFFILIGIFIMVFTEEISLTYIIFYLCVSLYLKNNFSKAINYSSDSEQYDLLRARIINSLILEIK